MTRAYSPLAGSTVASASSTAARRASSACSSANAESAWARTVTPRTSTCCGRYPTVAPRGSATAPASGSRSPAMMRRSVDLPAPLGVCRGVDQRAVDQQRVDRQQIAPAVAEKERGTKRHDGEDEPRHERSGPPRAEGEDEHVEVERVGAAPVGLGIPDPVCRELLGGIAQVHERL